MGKDIINHRRTQASHGDRKNPSFRDEVLSLPCDDDAEYLRIRVFDEPPSRYPDDAERLASAVNPLGLSNSNPNILSNSWSF